MAIQFRCRDCEEPLKAPDAAAGKVMTCKECGTKNKVPARKGTKKGAKKKRKKSPKAAAGDGDFLAGADLGKSDQRFTVCQKCGEQYTGGDPLCPYCGYDHETEAYTKEAKREQLKKKGLVDPTEYFEIAKSEAMKFTFDKAMLSLRSGLYVLFPSLLCMGAMFLVVYNGKGPPKVFFGFIAFVFGIAAIGWMMQYCQILVRAKLDGDEKLDRVTYDFFGCAAEGLGFFALQMAWLLPAILAMVGAYLYGEDQHEVGIALLAAGPILMLPVYPLILSHLAMPVNWPAWLFTKGLTIWGNVLSPSMYWAGFTVLAMLPAIIGFGVVGAVFGDDIQSFIADVDFNGKRAYEQYLADRGEGEAPTVEAREIKWDSIVAPMVIASLCLFYIGFAASYPARLTAWYALYFRKPLELIQEKKERKYVAKERKVDEDGNIVVATKGPPEIVLRLLFTVAFYVVLNIVVYFGSGGQYLVLPPGVGEALGFEPVE